MKKFLYSVMLLAGVAVFASCDHEFLGDKDPVGGTATEATAGEWYVWADAIDADGAVIEEDFYEGRFLISSFNTVENVSNKMFIMVDAEIPYFHNEGSKGMQILVDVNAKDKTFEATDSEDLWSGNLVTVKNGKVSYGTGVQNNGSKCDEISFEVYFDPTTEYYCAAYGIAGYLFHGVRYSGLAEND